MKNTLLILLLFISITSCAQSPRMVDKKATSQTVALYANLKTLSQSKVLFGHQDDAAYGVGWRAIDGRSDVKEVTGSFPAIYGWDIGKIGKSHNLDGVKFDSMVHWIKGAYVRGGVNTISWHIDNLVTNEGSWDKTHVVKHILPGGTHHAVFLKHLDYAAEFLNQCRVGSTLIPIIFRPWHEHNGDWFWWGKGNCTEEEYKALWRFTVTYLRDKKGLHNLIYAFSPDRSRLDMSKLEASYLYGYPGDEYVDIIGLDNYMDVGVKWNQKSGEEQRNDYVQVLSMITSLAKQKNKVAALTETGLETISNPNWFSSVILDPIKNNPNIKIAYMLVWRNANEGHCYAPYVGHDAVEDFKKFHADDVTLFESDLKNIYTR